MNDHLFLDIVLNIVRSFYHHTVIDFGGVTAWLNLFSAIALLVVTGYYARKTHTLTAEKNKIDYRPYVSISNIGVEPLVTLPKEIFYGNKTMYRSNVCGFEYYVTIKNIGKIPIVCNIKDMNIEMVDTSMANRLGDESDKISQVVCLHPNEDVAIWAGGFLINEDMQRIVNGDAIVSFFTKLTFEMEYRKWNYDGTEFYDNTDEIHLSARTLNCSIKIQGAEMKHQNVMVSQRET